MYDDFCLTRFTKHPWRYRFPNSIISYDGTWRQATISKSFYARELSQFIEMKSLDQIVEIECAGGTQLPYEGYIEADIKTPGDSNALTRNIMLVVPDSQYSLHVPVLIGTIILRSMMEQLNKEHGERFLQPTHGLRHSDV